MGLFGNNVLCFDNYVDTTRNKEINQTYDCFMTQGRLSGFCDLLICEKGWERADLFCLSFSKKGVLQYVSLQSGQEIRRWFDTQNCVPITYFQALSLLGDAARQNYKHKSNVEWINNNGSVHLQKIWMDEYYNDTSSMNWMLTGQDEQSLLQTYLSALENNDGALLYDMTASAVTIREPREVYTLCWNHVLEEFATLDYELTDRMFIDGSGERIIFLIAYGEYNKDRILAVDIRLHVILEHGRLRISREQILEARCLCKRVQ